MRSSVNIPRRLIVAIGGNAMDPAEGKGTPEEQKAIAYATAKAMLPLLELDNQLVLVHGNGPQVGKLLLANAIARERVAPQSLDILVAQTQGAMAYILAQAFENALREVGNPRHVVGLVTQVEVDRDDPAFQNPTKPVGLFYTEDEAKAIAKDKAYSFIEDSGRGFRRVVASPDPIDIKEKGTIRCLMENGDVVIACGGGGIPVYREDGMLHGIDAVIDKDKAAAKLADLIAADTFIVLTAVPRVAINFGRPDQQWLERITVSQAKEYIKAGHFAPGSMLPKVEAAIRFVSSLPGRQAIITSLENACHALTEGGGTVICAD